MEERTFASLKARHRKTRDGFSQDLSLRVHRALSWLERAEMEVQRDDQDAAFIFARGCSHLYRERPTSCRASYGFTTLAVNGLAHRFIFHFKLSGRVVPMAPNSS